MVVDNFHFAVVVQPKFPHNHVVDGGGHFPPSVVVACQGKKVVRGKKKSGEELVMRGKNWVGVKKGEKRGKKRWLLTTVPKFQMCNAEGNNLQVFPSELG